MSAMEEGEPRNEEPASPDQPKETPAPVAWQPPPGSWASSAANRRSMVGNRSRDTSPELLVRSAVHRAGLRYRVAARPSKTVRRSADIVFGPQRIAVFIDGCFWHGCPEHFVLPKTNTEYWREKIAGNRRRDAETDQLLNQEGWTVMRFWEHDDPLHTAEKIVTLVRRLKAEAARSRHDDRGSAANA